MERRDLRQESKAWLRYLIWSFDPGLIQSAKAAIALVALALAIGAAKGLAAFFPEHWSANAMLFAGVGVLGLVLIVGPEPKQRQRRLLLVGASAFQTILLSLGLIALLTPEQAPWLAKLLLLPLAALGLALSTASPGAKGLGKAIFLFAMITAMQSPRWADTPSLMLATGFGSGLFFLLITFLPKPSALSALPAAKRAFLQELAERLEALADSEPGHPPKRRRYWLGRQPLRSLLRTARLQEPGPQDRVIRQLLIAYSMEQTLRLLSHSLATTRGLPEALWQQSQDALHEAADVLKKPLNAPQPGSDAAARLRETALALPASQADPRRHLVAAAAALRRLLLLRELIHRAETEEAPAQPAAVASAVARPPSGLSPAKRLVLQGLVGVSLANLIDLAFDMEHGYWATITAFMILSGSLGETLLRGQRRILGTAIGVMTAMTYVWLLGDRANGLLTGLAVAALFVVIVIVQRYWGAAAVGIGFLVIALLHLVEDLTLAAMFARIYETLIGAAIGIAVARLVLPLHLGRQLRRELKAWLAAAAEQLSQLGRRAPEDLRQGRVTLVRHAAILGDSLPLLRAESWIGLRVLDRPVAVHTALEAICGYLALLEYSARGLPFEQGDEPSDREAREQRQQALHCLTALYGGAHADVHQFLSDMEERLHGDGNLDFEESDPHHLETRLEQIFYLAGLIQVVDDLSLALETQ